MQLKNWMRSVNLDEPEEKELRNKIDDINARNYKIFGLTQQSIIEATKVKYVPCKQERRKAVFSNGNYVTYTDNIDNKEKFIYPWVSILTVHGNPGDEKEWNFLESSMHNKCRFINFVVPGYDGETEIRNNYDGSYLDVCVSIKRLLDYLKIDKIYYCGHSMGSIIMRQFVYLFPHRIDALIMPASAPHNLYLGYTVFGSLVREFYLNQVQDFNRLNDPELRKQFHQGFNKLTQEVYFQVDPKEKKISFPRLTETELSAWFKMTRNALLREHLAYIDRIEPNIPKIIFFANNDPLVEWQSYYHHTDQMLKKDPINYEKGGITKEEVAKILNCDVNLLPNSLQELFLVVFDKGGHQVHVRHGKVIAELVEKFIQVNTLNAAKKSKISPKL
jgi:pimeloyl-ACP methyl ester carboxylesterase